MKKSQNPFKSQVVRLQIGILTCLGLAILALGWKSEIRNKILPVANTEEIHVLDLPPITKPKKKELPKEEPKKTRISLKPGPVKMVPDSTEIKPDTSRFSPVDTFTIRREPEPVEKVPYFKVEQKPRFEECKHVEDSKELEICFMKAVASYIRENARIPEEAKRNNEMGKVWVSFVINAQGTTEQVEVVRGVSYSLDEEAIRLVEEMPKMIPGKQRGKPVSVAFTLPINFKYR